MLPTSNPCVVHVGTGLFKVWAYHHEARRIEEFLQSKGGVIQSQTIYEFDTVFIVKFPEENQ
jgi:hypothetical protein